MSVINFFLGMESFLYRKARHISVISKSFRQTLLSKGVPASKIEVIPVWADPDEVRPLQKENGFRHKHGLNGKFVVLYAGNIGLTSCLEDVLAAAEILRNRNDIRIVFVGEGVKKEALEAESRARNLDNVLFLPYQPREEFAEMLAAADMGLVTLNPGAGFSSLPSKTFNVMASGRPILAVTPQTGEVARLIRVAGCGWNVLPSSPRKLAGAIIELKGQGSLLTQMGKNGRCYLERHYARSCCVDTYEKLLTTLFEQTRVEATPVREVL